MKTKQAVQHFLDYHRANSKKNTLRNYRYVLGYFQIEFGDRDIVYFKSTQNRIMLHDNTQKYPSCFSKIRNRNINVIGSGAAKDYVKFGECLQLWTL